MNSIDRISEFFRLVSTNSLELRRVKLVGGDQIIKTMEDFFSIQDVPKFYPIVKYLIFGRSYLQYMDNESFPLKHNEIARIKLLKKSFKIYKTSQDFYLESFNGVSIPNRIIDLVLIGNPSSVAEQYKKLMWKKKFLRRKLIKKLGEIRKYFERDPEKERYYGSHIVVN